VWDFSGNEAYYITHPLFMSARSLYLLVFRLSDDLDRSIRKLDYWLQLANCRSGNAPVLLVGTNLDHKRCSKEYLEAIRSGLATRYASRYNNIKGFFATSGKSRKGLKELIGAIQSVSLEQPYMGEEIPSKFLMLEDQIHQAAATTHPPILPRDQFVVLARKSGIVDDVNINAALEFLHQSGVAMYFRGVRGTRATSPLSNMVILSPQWLSNIFSSLIAHRNECVNKNGLLEQKLLEKIWSAPDHLAEQHPLYMGLVEKFEIALPVSKVAAEKGLTDSGRVERAGEGRWLLPALLPDESYSLADLEKLGWKSTGQVKTKRTGK
jgi:hypothetical protein